MDDDLTAMYDMTDDEREVLTSRIAVRFSQLPELADVAAAVPRRDGPRP